MTDTTISILKELYDGITLYTISTPPHDPDQQHYAMLGDVGMEDDRLYDMLMDAVHEGLWKDYFESTWYPLAFGRTSGEAMDNLVNKIRTVECENAQKLVEVIRHHSWFIYDNFSVRLHGDLENAWDNVQPHER